MRRPRQTSSRIKPAYPPGSFQIGLDKGNIKLRHGHPRFYELTALEEDLHSRKNEDYAGTGRPLGNFERVSAFLAMFPGFPLDTAHGVALVYMLKQLDAALWLLATKREGKVEGVAERLGDIGVYAKLARIMYEEANATNKTD